MTDDVCGFRHVVPCLGNDSKLIFGNFSDQIEAFLFSHNCLKVIENF